MGYALAEKCAENGADVILVSGPVSIKPGHPGITRISVTSAEEMYRVSMENLEDSDIVILAAAVSDYTPVNPVDSKIKREKDNLNIELVPTRDIAAAIGREKRDDQITVGFALETNDEIENAKSKRKRKNLDIIVLNSLREKGAGFGVDTNKVSIIDKNNNIDKFELKSKMEVAGDILDAIYRIL